MEMNAPKSLLKVMHEIESEMMEFCDYNGSKELISLIKKRGCGFSVRSHENEHLWIAYEDAYIALNWDTEPSISFSTSGDNNTTDSKRFKQDEKVFMRLLNDLKKLKS